MRTVDVIARKRAGEELSAAEIDSLVSGYARGEVPDYQMSAWLMAACLRGLTGAETAALTSAIVSSGRVIDWTGRLSNVVDKHSSGGVGDKTSLVVVPMVAALGVPVAKMSGRGLGFTGGTLDKLESIPGLRVRLSIAEMQTQVERIGLAIVAQSAELAPADGKLYALRDATATVDYLPLIASSIMGKKIAGGAQGIVLDVKAGDGAFMTEVENARALAGCMLELGRRAGRRVRAVVSSMETPLGYAVGNSLEVAEALATLRGQGPADLLELCLVLGSQMLLLAGATRDEEEARRSLKGALASGAALGKLRQLVAAQGGQTAVVDDPGLLPRSPVVRTVAAPRGGFVARLSARTVAETVRHLGGGRARKEDDIDRSVGVVLLAKPGAAVEKGQPLCQVHAAGLPAAEGAISSLLAAYDIAPEPPRIGPLVINQIG